MLTRNWMQWTSECSFALAVDRNNESLADSAQEIISRISQQVEMTCNRFDASSEMSRINAAGTGSYVLSSVLADVIRESLAASHLTEGAFDPRVQPALEELGYTSHGLLVKATHQGWKATAISEKTLDESVHLTGNRLTLAEGTALDLTAMAKAYTADRCAREIAQQLGVPVFINLGGDIATAGSSNYPWLIKIQDLDTDPCEYVELINNAAIATSSTQKRRWVADGHAWHHIIDPRTGLSAHPYLRTASVIAGSATVANALSTAAVVCGEDAAENLERGGYSARLMASSHAITRTHWHQPVTDLVS